MVKSSAPSDQITPVLCKPRLRESIHQNTRALCEPRLRESTHQTRLSFTSQGFEGQIHQNTRVLCKPRLRESIHEKHACPLQAKAPIQIARLLTYPLDSHRCGGHLRIDRPMVDVGVVRGPRFGHGSLDFHLAAVPLHEVTVRVRVQLLLLVSELP